MCPPPRGSYCRPSGRDRYRRSLRAAAAVMRSTADRFDAVLSGASLSDGEVLGRLALEGEELCRAMETLERELGELAE